MNEIKKILLPIDFSEATLKILRYAIYLAEKNNAKISIVFVSEFPFTYSGHAPEDQPDENMQYAERRMDSFLEENLSHLSVPYEGTILSGHVAEEIISYAKSEEVDLLIIGTHGYRGLEKMLFGSVAEKVIKLAPCPVLTVNTYRRSETEGDEP
jgi:nucleotide-binding universal stress UspA family protein